MQDADAIIIGSGAGGMSAALALARHGQQVLLLEQHYVPGGWCHSFYLDGQRFSPGVHYIGDLGVGQRCRRTFEGLGIANDLSFFQMNPNGYDHCLIGDRKIDLYAHPERMIETLRREFPHERRAIRRYIRLLDNVNKELYYALELESFRDYIMMPFTTRHLGRTGLFKLETILNRYFRDPVLKTALAMQCGNYGLPPGRTRFLLHAAVAGHYLHGGYYPAGGGGAITKAFTNGIRRAGGVIRTQAKVDRILIEKNRAIGVRLGDGTEMRSNVVVSNADPHRTYFRMVGEEHISGKFKRKLKRLTYSHAAVNTFMIVDTDLREFGVDSGNIWYTASDNLNNIYHNLEISDPFEGEHFAGLFLSCTTLKDPAAFDGRYHALEAVVFVPYRHFQKFADSVSGERSKAYMGLKEKLQAKLLRTVEKILPGVSKHIVRCEVGTPLTASHYVESTEGNSYGTEKILPQLGPMGYGIVSPISGLYHVGASTLSHGVMGASSSGVAATSKILGISGEEVLSHDSEQTLRIYSADDERSWPAWVLAKRESRERRRYGKSRFESTPG